LAEKYGNDEETHWKMTYVIDLNKACSEL